MIRFPRFNVSHARIHGGGLLSAAVLIAIASVAVGPPPAAAQMEYDFNEDGKVTCADFEEEFPDTYTDEATKALQQYPDDLSDLNNDPDEDDTACEGQPASAEAAEPDPTTQTPEPSPVAETPEAEAVDVPADVMARVAGCAVVAISSRDVVGAGCPGVGSIAFRIPDDAPSMQGTVLMHPGSPAADAAAAPESSTETRSGGSNQNDDTANAAEDTNSTKANKDKKKQSADSDKTGKDKDKNNKAKKGKSNNNKKKNEKKSGKHKNKNKKDGKQKGKK